MKKTGRKTKYEPFYAKEAYEYCSIFGATDKQLAQKFNVTESTLNLWKAKNKEFSESIKRGKDHFDTGVVEQSLLKRATGFEYEEIHTEIINGPRGSKTIVRKTKKLVPGDVLAQIFWLKNRNPDRWKDKQHVEHSGEVPELVVNIITEKEQANGINKERPL